VGGTLMRMDRERVAQKYVTLAHARGVTIDPEISLRTFSTLDDEIPARARAAPPLSLDERAGEIFWKSLFADGWSRLGLEKNDEAINHLYHDFRRGDFNRLFDDVLPALEALQKRNLTLGVVSNFTANCRDVLHTLGVAKYFPNGRIIVSAIVGAEKPAREIFDYAARSVKCPANESV
jgi:FMN phosphatase YigB (HAD superfamily)